MKITDLHGCPIEVTNLHKAIRQAKQYKDFRHEDKSFSRFDQKQNAYWADMYNKLIQRRIKFKNTLK
ncbi:hypothetical protein [Chryseobacterium paludis]|uniref:hypothetical protein n=1 Tax=Chryseobacterium paludis TaxID=2956784 RepID=UPI0021C1451A|nr:hypothetical protein [Chryseobacterium paludis]